MQYVPLCPETCRHDELHVDSMHPQQHNIVWDEDYDEPCMRPYPLLPVVCVRAGMGTGKTKEMKRTISEHSTPETTVLAVTFSRALAAKLFNEFGSFGFHDYLASKGMIDAKKVVVCLDSLWRVTTREFDFVIVDEAVSVFLHLNSPLMKRSIENTALLEQIMKVAQHCFFLDACLDTTFVKQIVEYFAQGRSQDSQPYWIRNRYVRPSNRTVRSHVRFGNVFASYGLQKLAMARVVDLLRGGKRVVVCSSTKKFTQSLGDFVRENRPGTKMQVYNGDTGGVDLVDIATLWTKLDLLVYSPTITAGVSFEVPHFDSLVAYFVNSVYTPGVDIALQQMFRVRELNEGDMYLYIADSCPDAMLPTTDAELEALLRDEAVDVSKMIAGGIDPMADRLSHLVVKGILAMQNRSASNYTAILHRTLREDYGIQCTRVDANDRDIDAKIPAYTASAGVPFEEARKLVKAYGSDAGMQDGEARRAAARLCTFARRLWDIPFNNIDKAFYDAYVCSADARDKFLRAKRFKMCVTQSLAANHQELDMCDADERESVAMLLEAQSLLLKAGVNLKDLKAFRVTKIRAASVPIDVDLFAAKLHEAFALAVRRLSNVPGDPGYSTVELAPKELKRVRDAWAPWFLKFA